MKRLVVHLENDTDEARTIKIVEQLYGVRRAYISKSHIWLMVFTALIIALIIITATLIITSRDAVNFIQNGVTNLIGIYLVYLILYLVVGPN